MHYLTGSIGLLIVFSLSYLISGERRKIAWKSAVTLLIVQFLLAFFLLRTSIGAAIIDGLAKLFSHLMSYAYSGVAFVYGTATGTPAFFFAALMPIIFISAVIGILRYLKILPFFMKWIGIGLSKFNGLGKLESYNGIASAILGQSQVFVSLKTELALIDEKRVVTLAISAMSTASLSIVGSYMLLIKPKYVITALILNLFGGFLIANIVNPYNLNSKEDELVVEEEKQTFFQMLSEYIFAGLRIAFTISGMLIGFTALITMINALFSVVTGLTFQEILGYIFAPLAFLTGIPWKSAVSAGSLMATKLISNEFVAMTELYRGNFAFSPRTTAILSVFLVSFANFSSIGIVTGAIKGLNAEKANLVAKHGLKILLSATLVSFLSAIITGLLF